MPSEIKGSSNFDSDSAGKVLKFTEVIWNTRTSASNGSGVQTFTSHSYTKTNVGANVLVVGNIACFDAYNGSGTFMVKINSGSWIYAGVSSYVNLYSSNQTVRALIPSSEFNIGSNTIYWGVNSNTMRITEIYNPNSSDHSTELNLADGSRFHYSEIGA